ncbi:hypothetical protein BDZ91DRAFT_800390 [Kalaharituber pfeilii]|nr:hypothetical protein BDZ91DRAFT_800390 [Kalaharituber pfeilii]
MGNILSTLCSVWSWLVHLFRPRPSTLSDPIPIPLTALPPPTTTAADTTTTQASAQLSPSPLSATAISDNVYSSQTFRLERERELQGRRAYLERQYRPLSTVGWSEAFTIASRHYDDMRAEREGGGSSARSDGPGFVAVGMEVQGEEREN